jgi:hypothetical protein
MDKFNQETETYKDYEKKQRLIFKVNMKRCNSWLMRRTILLINYSTILDVLNQSIFAII